MNLRKKITMGAIVAILAAVILTGCTDTPPNPSTGENHVGTGSGNSSSSSSGSSSTGDKKEDTTPPKENGNKDDKPNIKTSRMAKYYTYKEKLNQYDYKYQMVNQQNNEVTTTEIITDGNRVTYREWEGDEQTKNLISDEKKQEVFSVPSQAQEVYCCQYDSGVNGVKMSENAKMFYDLRKFDYPMIVGTREVDGEMYYSETFVNEVGQSQRTYCFEKDDTEGRCLKYILFETTEVIPKETGRVIILKDDSKVNFADLRIPAGRTILNDKMEEIGTTQEDNYPD